MNIQSLALWMCCWTEVKHDMALGHFKARQKLLKFKNFFSEVALNTEAARDRLFLCSDSELVSLIYFLSLVFKGKISISLNRHKLIKKQKRFLELESIFLSNNQKSLKDRKFLIRFTKIIVLLLEVLVL